MSLLVVAYVFMGGAISAGVAGFAKLLISFTALLVFGATTLTIGGGITTNIGWNLMVSQSGAAVFIGLAGSVVGLSRR